jgi:hypothetical protein
MHGHWKNAAITGLIIALLLALMAIAIEFDKRANAPPHALPNSVHR